MCVYQIIEIAYKAFSNKKYLACKNDDTLIFTWKMNMINVLYSTLNTFNLSHSLVFFFILLFTLFQEILNGLSSRGHMVNRLDSAG